MDAINIYTYISNMYSVLNDKSVLSMFPFLILKPTDDKKDLYRFSQFNGSFFSIPFDIGDFKFKELVIITPFRVQYNKILLEQIDKNLQTGEFSVYISFINKITLMISLYNNKYGYIKKYKFKLVSFMFDFKFLDLFFYHFRMTDKERYQLRLNKLTQKTDNLRFLIDTYEEKDFKKVWKNTKRLISKIKKRVKKEEKNRIKDRNNKMIENIYNQEKLKHQHDIENIANPMYDENRKKQDRDEL